MAENDVQARNALGRSLINSEFSDLEIICGDYRWHVHRAIVCPLSSYFKAACNKAFTEGQNCQINLSEENHWTVKNMLQFIYTRDYDEMKHLDGSNSTCGITGVLAEDGMLDERLRVHARMYIAGEYYGVLGLKRHAYQKIARSFDKNFGVVEEPRPVFVPESRWELKISASAMVDIVKLVWENLHHTQVSIRRLFVHQIQERLPYLLERDDFTFLLQSNHELAIDLLRELTSTPYFRSRQTDGESQLRFFCSFCREDVEDCSCNEDDRNGPFIQMHIPMPGPDLD